MCIHTNVHTRTHTPACVKDTKSNKISCYASIGRYYFEHLSFVIPNNRPLKWKKVVHSQTKKKKNHGYLSICYF